VASSQANANPHPV
jgi:hypothetical protein